MTKFKDDASCIVDDSLMPEGRGGGARTRSQPFVYVTGHPDTGFKLVNVTSLKEFQAKMDGMRVAATMRMQTPRDYEYALLKKPAGRQAFVEQMAPVGKRSYPRDKLFMSTAANGRSYMYSIAGKWLRRVEVQTGQVTTLLNVVSGSGMKTRKDVAALEKKMGATASDTNLRARNHCIVTVSSLQQHCTTVPTCC